MPDRELEAKTDQLVQELRGFSPLAQRTAKKLLNDTGEASLSVAIELEGHWYSRLRQPDDLRKEVEAFEVKRTPNFVGIRGQNGHSTKRGFHLNRTGLCRPAMRGLKYLRHRGCP